MENNIYKLKIKNTTISCNDILQAISNKLDEEKINVSNMEWVFYSQTIKYLMRAFFKGQTDSDLNKAISELQLLIKLGK